MIVTVIIESRRLARKLNLSFSNLFKLINCYLETIYELWIYNDVINKPNITFLEKLDFFSTVLSTKVCWQEVWSTINLMTFAYLALKLSIKVLALYLICLEFHHPWIPFLFFANSRVFCEKLGFLKVMKNIVPVSSSNRFLLTKIRNRCDQSWF